MNDSTNTQTQRTDAAEQRDITGLGVVQVDFARKLERELADYRARTKEIIDEDHERILALIHERDTYKARAEERRALRVEIEQALGMESKPGDTSDDALKQGLATIAALRAALARVTAELKAVSLSAFTSIKNGSETMDALRSKIAEYDTECTRLTDRVSSLEMERATLRARNAELVAALRAIRDLDDDATAEDCAARAGSALTRAESATATVKESLTVKLSPQTDAEAMIAACIPGGSICDPQQVADAIREYLRPQEPCGGRCGDPDCNLDTNGVTMRAPAPHADTVCHKCGAQIMDPFTGMKQIHDVERCNGKAAHD